MVGIPDLLKKEGSEYLPIDIKSGRGYGDFSENGEEKLKKHYAVQLCLYDDILQKLEYASENKGIIIDGRGEEVDYDLDLPMGKKDLRTYWQYYEEIKAEARKLIADEIQNIPALGSVCKMCIWYTSCKKWCYAQDDLTKLFYLGRSKRDVLNKVFGIMTTIQMSEMDLETILATKKQKKINLRECNSGKRL